MNRRTYSAKSSEVQRAWYVVDAEGKTLGRLATEVANTLRGKHKPMYTPHVDTGDFVVVINAEKIQVTGNKETQKVYYRHSNYPGGLKETTLKDMRRRFPVRIIENAVKGMMPTSNLGRQQYKKLRVYAGPSHPHEAQNPTPLELDERASR